MDKRQFLDVLMGSKNARSERVDEPVKDEGVRPTTAPAPGWSVLRDDFMAPAKLKDWDKEDT